MTRRYSFTITRVSTGVVEIHVPDDDDACMEGATPDERETIRMESAIGDIASIASELEEASDDLGRSNVTVDAVRTDAELTHDPL